MNIEQDMHLHTHTPTISHSVIRNRASLCIVCVRLQITVKALKKKKEDKLSRKHHAYVNKHAGM